MEAEKQGLKETQVWLMVSCFDGVANFHFHAKGEDEKDVQMLTELVFEGLSAKWKTIIRLNPEFNSEFDFDSKIKLYFGASRFSVLLGQEGENEMMKSEGLVISIGELK